MESGPTVRKLNKGKVNISDIDVPQLSFKLKLTNNSSTLSIMADPNNSNIHHSVNNYSIGLRSTTNTISI